MSQSIDEKVREVTAKYAREAKEAEERALQARKAQSTAADAYDRRLAERQEQEAKEAEHRARQEIVQKLKDTNAEVRAELTSVRNERARCHAIESAGNAEHDPETRLN